MIVQRALSHSEIPLLDAEVLLGYVLQKDRAWLLAHSEYVLNQRQEEQFRHSLERAKKEEPIAYITEEKEFYGRTFHVDPRVLIPRPATEGLVDLVLDTLRKPDNAVRDIDTDIVAVSHIFQKSNSNNLTIVDVGTGSGCIAVTLACELRDSRSGAHTSSRRLLAMAGKQEDTRIIATDVSGDALEVAKRNAEEHGVSDRIAFLKGNLLEPVSHMTEPFLLISNPPYISESTRLPKSVVGYEPHRALFSGKDGADILRTLFLQASKHPLCRGVIMECHRDQLQILTNQKK